MDKVKEIQGMMPYMCFVCEMEDGLGKCFKGIMKSCSMAKMAAENIINAGYGDKKQAVKDFAEKLKVFIIRNCCVTDDDVDKIYKKINELVKEVTGE